MARAPTEAMALDAMTAPPVRFRDRRIMLGDGSVGENIDIPSAGPNNCHQALSRAVDMARMILDGKPFLPPDIACGPLPLVIVVPGSLGVAASHLARAETITAAGIAALVLDPLGVGSAQRSATRFTASAYDVLAAWQGVGSRAEIDASRIGAQGHSRGDEAERFRADMIAYWRRTPLN